jgi:uncharacterized protein (TIGR02996 family)
MKVGDRVTIRRGAFKDFMATIDRVVGDAIYATLEVFGRTTPITITKDDLETEPAPEADRERLIELGVRRRRAHGWVSSQFFRLEARRETPREPAVLYPLWKAYEANVWRECNLEVDAELARFRAEFEHLDQAAATAKWQAERVPWLEDRKQLLAIVATLEAELGAKLSDEQVEFAARELQHRVERWHTMIALAEPIAPEPRNLAIEQQIERDVDRDENFLIYADWLQANGNPRGELIALEAAHAPTVARVREQLEPKLLGPLADLEERIAPTWRLGFLDSIKVETTRHDEDEALTVTKLLAVALALPSARFLRLLTIGLPSIHEEVSLVDTLVAAGSRPALRSIALITNQEEEMLSWTDAGELAPIVALYPNLESLEVCAGGYTLTEPNLPKLRRLVLQTCHAPDDIVRTLVQFEWPELETLELWFGSSSYEHHYPIEMLAPLLTAKLPKLRRLGICNCEVTDELCTAIVESPLLSQLERLSFAKGTMTEVGANILIENAARLAHLEEIDVDDNYLDAASLAILTARLPIKSRWQRSTEDEGGRFASVGE